MNKYLIVTLLLAMVIGLVGSSTPAVAEETDPAAVVEAVYTAVSENDIEGAMALLADDAVLTLVPPPGGLDGTFVGKEEIGAWFENLAADNVRYEYSDVATSGNTATMKLISYDDFFDSVIGGPAEFDGVAVVQDGLWKSVSWVFTPEFMETFDAAMARQTDVALVERILTEIWSEGNLDLVDELVAEDYVSHTWPIGAGRDDFIDDVTSWRADFPGATIVVDRIVWDGNRAIMFNHNVEPGGSLEKLPRGEDIDDILVYQIEDGKLSDRWYLAPFDPME